MENKQILNEMETILKDNIKTTITQAKFRHKKTGEIKTQISIMEIGDYEKI